MPSRLPVLAGFFALAAAASAHAAPGLANKVYSPYVEKGETEIEIRGGRLTGGPDNGEASTIFEIEHGFSDRLNLALLAEVEDEPGDGPRIEAVAVEGVAYLGHIRPLKLDVGVYGEYEQRLHGGGGKLETKLLLARQFGQVQGLFNLIVEKDHVSGPASEPLELGYAVEATAPVARGTRLGVQAFGELGTTKAFGGRQEHFLGPVAKWKMKSKAIGGAIEFEAAYLVALGSARDDTDGQVRFALEFEKRF